MRYPGGKASPGVYQRIICQMPPHQVYIEPFLGGGSVMRLKLPARWNYGIDRDRAVVAAAAALAGSGDWVQHRPPGSLAGDDAAAGFEFVAGDGIDWLAARRSFASTVVYCDPPYVISARRSPRRMYRYELEDDRHVDLLRVLVELDCPVLLSGYDSKLYRDRLSSWRVVRYPVMTRGGYQVEESLWMNYPEPLDLHDYGYLGDGFRERERIKRKRARWTSRLLAMPALERYALLSSLAAVRARADL
jgi:DNA adenine methylase